jgi:hypothetical protein
LRAIRMPRFIDIPRGGAIHSRSTLGPYWQVDKRRAAVSRNSMLETPTQRYMPWPRRSYAIGT